MKIKKVPLIIISVVLILAIGLTVTLCLLRYMFDGKDTEEFYRQNVASVGYSNTIETAIPQTELYNMIKGHFNSALPEGKTEKKAIIIGYDGCRADILNEIDVNNSAITALVNDGGSKKLAYCGGVNYPEINTQDTSTAPGWCSILTGVWADVHGITGNDISKSMDTKTLLTSLAEEGTADSTAFYTKWSGHFDRANATYLNEKQYCESKNLNVQFNKLNDDDSSLNAVMGELGKERCADFMFVIYEPTDITGHGWGFSYNNPKYKKAFKETDAYGMETLKAIYARENYIKEDWLIIITSDHGGIKANHGKASIQERMTFVVTNRPE